MKRGGKKMQGTTLGFSRNIGQRCTAPRPTGHHFGKKKKVGKLDFIRS